MPVDPRLTALGFKPVGIPGSWSRRRLFIANEGPTATGKTDFLRRCPPPQVVIDLDRGTEGVLETDIWGNEILRKSIDLPDLDEFGLTASPGERSVALQSYTAFKKLMEDTFKAFAAIGGGTIQVDTGGAAYTLAQVARFGRIAQVGEVPPAMWTSMAGEFQRIFLQYEDYPVNLIVTHRQGSKFGGLPGDRELKGYKEMKHLAQVHLAFEKRMLINDKGAPVRNPLTGNQEFELLRIALKSRQRLGLEGAQFPVVFLDDAKTKSVGGDFLAVALAVFPNTTAKDWIGELALPDEISAG